jgi:hypothetical protein
MGGVRWLLVVLDGLPRWWAGPRPLYATDAINQKRARYW